MQKNIWLVEKEAAELSQVIASNKLTTVYVYLT